VEPCQPGCHPGKREPSRFETTPSAPLFRDCSGGRPRSLAAVFRFQFGLPFCWPGLSYWPRLFSSLALPITAVCAKPASEAATVPGPTVYVAATAAAVASDARSGEASLPPVGVAPAAMASAAPAPTAPQTP
jgi:hypothetical protein